MTMRPTDEGGETVALDVTLLFYLKGREEPVDLPVTYEIPRRVVEHAGEELSNAMQCVLLNIIETIEAKSEYCFLFSDSRHSKFLIVCEEFQGVSIIAPDEESLLQALEG